MYHVCWFGNRPKMTTCRQAESIYSDERSRLNLLIQGASLLEHSRSSSLEKYPESFEHFDIIGSGMIFFTRKILMHEFACYGVVCVER